MAGEATVAIGHTSARTRVNTRSPSYFTTRDSNVPCKCFRGGRRRQGWRFPEPLPTCGLVFLSQPCEEGAVTRTSHTGLEATRTGSLSSRQAQVARLDPTRASEAPRRGHREGAGQERQGHRSPPRMAPGHACGTRVCRDSPETPGSATAPVRANSTPWEIRLTSLCSGGGERINVL